MQTVSSIRWNVFLPLVAMAALGCTFFGPKPQRISRAFYVWQQTPELTPKDVVRLRKWQVDTLYLRMFDVTWDRRKAQVQYTPAVHLTHPRALDEMDLIPVVFITADVFARMPAAGRSAFAKDVLARIAKHLPKSRRPVSEVQIDCDWHPSMRQEYFAFLEMLKPQAQARWPGVTLSATLRLSQLRDRDRAGVPPVDRLALMFYNVRPVTRFHAENALIDVDLITGYVKNAPPYPLPMDLAVGVFSWAAQFNADGKFMGLLRNVRAGDLQTRSDEFTAVDGFYQVKKRCTLQGNTLLPGDMLRVDEHARANVAALSKVIRAHRRRLLPNDRFRAILFHYQGSVLARFSAGDENAVETIWSTL